MSVEREPIKFDEGETKPVYVADAYVNKRPNKKQRQLQPYYLDTLDIKGCYFPIDSFGKREPTLNLTRELLENCVERSIPIVMETRTTIPSWAVDAMAKVRGSVLIIQLPTVNVTMKRRFFSSIGSPSDIRQQVISVFQTGTNVRLKFAPLIPTVTKLSEMMAFMITIKSFINGVDVAFSRLTKEDIDRIEKRNRVKSGELLKLYDCLDGEYFVKDEVRDDMLNEFRAFCDGNDIPVTEY